MRRHQRHLTIVLNEHTIMILTLGNPNTSKTANYNSNKIYKKVRSVIFLYMSLRSEMLKDTYRDRFLWGRCSISAFLTFVVLSPTISIRYPFLSAEWTGLVRWIRGRRQRGEEGEHKPVRIVDPICPPASHFRLDEVSTERVRRTKYNGKI